MIAVFVMDGQNVSAPGSKSVKLDMGSFFNKYNTGGMKDADRVMFQERVYLEILEAVSQ